MSIYRSSNRLSVSPGSRRSLALNRSIRRPITQDREYFEQRLCMAQAHNYSLEQQVRELESELKNETEELGKMQQSNQEERSRLDIQVKRIKNIEGKTKLNEQYVRELQALVKLWNEHRKQYDAG